MILIRVALKSFSFTNFEKAKGIKLNKKLNHRLILLRLRLYQKRK